MIMRYLMFIILMFSAVPNIIYSQVNHRIIAQIGGALESSDRISVAVMDKNEDIIVAGTFSYSAYVKDSTKSFTSPNKDDIFVVKLDKEGNPIWQKAFGSLGSDFVQSLVIDNDGNSYCAGGHSADFNLEGEKIKANGTITPLLVKLDKDGRKAWVKTYTANGAAWFRAVKTDNSGNVYACGILQASTITIDGTTLSSSEKNAFIVKYNSDGVLQWAKLMHNNNYLYIVSIGITPDGILIGGGVGNGSITFGDNVVSKDNSTAGIYYAKLDNNGSIQWIKYGISGMRASVKFLKLADDNNIYVGGSFDDSLRIESANYKTVGKGQWGDDDIFLLKVNNKGNIIWHKAIGSEQSDQLNDMLIDSDNNLIITGGYSNELGLGDTTLKSVSRDIFIVKYNKEGNYLNSISSKAITQGFSSAYPASIMEDKNKNLYIAGWFNYKTQFGDTVLIRRNNDDGFIWKIESGISEISEIAKPIASVSVFPNPSPGIFNIEFTLEKTENLTFEITDLTGRTVIIKQKNIYMPGNYIEKMDLSSLHSGIYIVKVKTNGKILTRKVIISKN